uniref:Uncharacterized protein LOC105036826 isoform X1 n=1 Tax=Elaeis guineensis var. tenera TaxID=51953 RepID=A0A8N4EUK0_ELAGV|nr:uncharacterized protein LOC105036826 isoform X1 [Elaeis guineensis]
MGSTRAAVVAPDKYKRRKVFAHRDFPKGCGRRGQQLSDLSDPEKAPLVEKEPFLDPMEPSKPNNVDRAEKKEKAGLLKVSAVRRFPRGLGKPDEEISEFSEPEEEEVEALNLEEKDLFLDRMESMKSEDVSKGSTDGLGFSDAEKRFLSERYNLAKWRWVSAVRDFPTGCGTNSTNLRLKRAVAKKPRFRKPVGCMPSKKIESGLKGNNGLLDSLARYEGDSKAVDVA